MNMSDVKSSKFLKRDDVGEGTLVTISDVSKENVAKEGAEPELKVCLHFLELEKPFVLNSTNGQIIAKITGKENDIEKTWLGTKVVLYDDPNVSFGGKLTGGIRVRAPRIPKTATQQTAPLQEAKPLQASDLPF